MSTGFLLKRWTCKIGKKKDKSDCAKKDCENCRHYIVDEVWQDCLTCEGQCDDCPLGRNKEEG